MQTKKQLIQNNQNKDNTIKALTQTANQLQEQLEKKSLQKNDDFIQLSRNPGAGQLICLALKAPTAMAIYIALSSLCDCRNMVAMKQSTLAEIIECSPRAVRQAIKELISRGLLEVAKDGNRNIYILNPDIVWNSYANQKKYCKYEGTTVIDDKTLKTISEANNRLLQKRKALTKTFIDLNT